ncbi:MAG TPA: sugar phosphate isomerase/epimerase family protein [Planctomycetota bacterium]
MIDRRSFLAASGALAIPLRAAEPSKFALGTVSYNIGAKMDLATLLRTCKAAGFEAVELRTTHGHKVEPSLSADERKDVRKRIEDSGVRLWGFGSVCEFHAADPAVVKKNVADCVDFCKLAQDLGAKGVKVRPNGFPKGVEPAKTLEQIGLALRECGKAAADHGVEIWVEVHGAGTQEPKNVRTFMDHCGHSSVGVCWNSNPTDVKDGSIKEAFDLLKKDIKSCHINELWSAYPWRELFASLAAMNYDRVTLMEVAGVPESPESKDPADAALRFMRYYRALWRELLVK